MDLVHLLETLVPIVFGFRDFDRHFDLFAIEDILRQLLQLFNRTVVARRESGFRPDQEPKIPFGVVVHRVAIFVDEDVPAPRLVGLDGEHHRPFSIPERFENGLRRLGVGPEEVLRRVDFPRVAFQRFRHVEDDDSFLLVLFFDAQHPDVHGVFAQPTPSLRANPNSPLLDLHGEHATLIH